MVLRSVLGAAVVALALGIPGCSSSRPDTRVVVVASAPRHGPPPHAPAHGYRHKHRDGVNLVYDAPRGVYVVVGHRDCYWDRDRYYRRHSGTWEVSVSLRGPWRVTAVSSLPSGLSAEATKPPKGKGKGKKH